MENEILNYIDASLLIMVVFIYCLGLFIKKAPFIKDWLIPFILLFTSIAITIVYMAFVQGYGITVVVIINGLIQGVLVASVAVFGDQTVKQIMRKDD